MAFGDTKHSYDPERMQNWIQQSSGRATHGGSQKEDIILKANDLIQSGAVRDAGDALRIASERFGTSVRDLEKVSLQIANFFREGNASASDHVATYSALNPHYAGEQSGLYDSKLKAQSDYNNSLGQRGIEIAREQLQIQKMSLESARQRDKNLQMARIEANPFMGRLQNARDSYHRTQEATAGFQRGSGMVMGGLLGGLTAAASSASPDIFGTIGLNARLLASDIGSDPAFARAAVRISAWLADLRSGWRQLAPETRDASIGLVMKGTIAATGLYAMSRFGLPAMAGIGGMMGFSQVGMGAFGRGIGRFLGPAALAYGAYEAMDTMRQPFVAGADANIARLRSPARPAGHSSAEETAQYTRILAVIQSGNQAAIRREIMAATGHSGNMWVGNNTNAAFSYTGAQNEAEFLSNPDRAARALAHLRSSSSDRASAVLGTYDRSIPFLEIGGHEARNRERITALRRSGFSQQDIAIAMRSTGLTSLGGTLAEPNLGQDRIQSLSRNLSETQRLRSEFDRVMAAGGTLQSRSQELRRIFGLNSHQDIVDMGGTRGLMRSGAVDAASRTQAGALFANLMGQSGVGRMADLQSQREHIMASMGGFQSRQYGIESLHDVIQQQAVRPEGEQQLFHNMAESLANILKEIRDENVRRANAVPVVPPPLPPVPVGWN
jgi:hypothetical protein